MSALRPVVQASTTGSPHAATAQHAQIPAPLSFHSQINFRQHCNTHGLSHLVQVFETIKDQLSYSADRVSDFFFHFFESMGDCWKGLFFKRSTPQPISPIPTLPITPNNPSILVPQTPSSALPLSINPASMDRTPRVISLESMEQDLRTAEAAVSDLNALLPFALAQNVRNLHLFLQFANSGNSEYFITLRSYFKGIIFELRKETTTDAMIRDAMQSLSQGLMGCPAIRFQAVEKVYKKLSGHLPTAENVILEAFQQYKENLFIQHYLLQDNPSFLNHIRREVGEELGLNTNPQMLNDPNIDNGPRGTREEYLAVFNGAISVQGLVRAMKVQLNNAMHDPEQSSALTGFLVNHFNQEQRQRILRWGYDFTNEGVSRILQQMGILT